MVQRDAVAGGTGLNDLSPVTTEAEMAATLESIRDAMAFLSYAFISANDDLEFSMRERRGLSVIFDMLGLHAEAALKLMK